MEAYEWGWAFVATAFGLWFAFGFISSSIKAYKFLKRRREDRQTDATIAAGKVPVDYDLVARRVRDLNDLDACQDAIVPETRARLGQMKRMRETVSIIRLRGYDRALDDRVNSIDVDLGLKNNPHEKGSGEAKQWARGYLMGANVRDIKRYIAAA
jgi:hypothetical protein